MKLKEIKPGMVIHCKNDEEKKALMEEAERLGYVWYYLKMKPTAKPIDQIGNTIHFYDENNHNGFTADYKHITHSAYKGGDVIEFSDLILPEMTADELLNILNEIVHCEGRSCDDCPLQEKGGNLCTKYVDAVKISNPDKLISICQQWKANHEKKEPEIETVDICRIIEIQPDGKKRCVHEEDISDGELMYSGDAVENCRYILKNYCKEHDGEFIAVHEVVSRVKKVI